MHTEESCARSGRLWARFRATLVQSVTNRLKKPVGFFTLHHKGLNAWANHYTN